MCGAGWLGAHIGTAYLRWVMCSITKSWVLRPDSGLHIIAFSHDPTAAVWGQCPMKNLRDLE